MASESEKQRPHGHEGSATSPTLSASAYVWSFVALVCLTLLSFWSSHVHLGAFGTPVALGIAAIKVTIVALVFMGMVDEPASSRVAGITAVLFVVLLASLAAVDVLTRF